MESVAKKWSSCRSIYKQNKTAIKVLFQVHHEVQKKNMLVKPGGIQKKI